MENKHSDHQVDIAVVGAGLVGLSAVIAFAQQGKRVALIDAKPMPDIASLTHAFDTRVYAVTPATEQWLRQLSVWPSLDNSRVNHISDMLLWQHNDDQHLNLSAEDARLSSLGCIVENQNLMHAFWRKVAGLDVFLALGRSCEAIHINANKAKLSLSGNQHISADLIVAADGVHSFVRQQVGIPTNDKDFEQTALVANFSTQMPHSDAARQWFAPHNTLALLPLPGNQVSMVWSLSTKMAAELLTLSYDDLTQQVADTAKGANLGRLSMLSDVISFPLMQVTSTTFIAERVALVGDAAHQVHPMAGQGANLGFRDVMALASMLAKAHHFIDIGELSFLRNYERNRKADILSMNTLTSGLDALFATNSGMLKKLTGLGMGWLNNQRLIKQLLVEQAIA